MIDLPDALPDSDNESLVFRPSKQYRNGQLWSLIFCPFSFLGLGILIGLEDSFDAQILGFLCVVVFGLIPALTALWGILVYRNVSLTLHDRTMILQGVFQRQKINLAEVTEARWRTDSELFLNPRTNRILIHLKYFHLQDRLWLIRFFHQELTETAQKHWNRFCHQIAIPLEERLQLLQQPETKLRAPGSGEILITRRRYDWIGIPLNTLLTSTVILISWHQNRYGYLILPAFTIGWWLFLRYSTPKRGEIQERIWAREDFRVFTYLLAAWGSAGLIGLVILLKSGLPEFVKVIGGFCLFLLCCELHLKMYNSATVHCREARRKIKDEAIQEWEAEQHHCE
ncbi:hypothetical protein Enr10x_37790 [Gimesia panareensis]|uniref:Uncharacterized protein n=1 Tax=Gimesia panareensis TaxID=2527978 RepID=A0A517Q9Y3_9PLAN|nr:hypothetical protein [Gimesia panareensis]QDT28437.1 hypothetical protein Enr10x_37790 [Gimesia panareensis]